MKLLSFLCLALIGCSHGGVAKPDAAETRVTSAAAAASPPLLPPLEGEWTQKIELSKGKQAYLTIPVGAQDKRAIIVGVHGAGDRPDWSCSEWQAVTAGWAFVVCPQGVTHPTDRNAFVWGSADAIASEADEAVAILKARYGAYLEDGPLIYGGWSQGATLASTVIASRPGVYDRAVLVELGYTPLDPAGAATNLEMGGIKRAVVSCSSPQCRGWAASFERAAQRKGIPVLVNDVGNRGHFFDGPVFRTLGPRVAWMVDDQARFAGLGAAVDARFSTD